MPSGVAQAPQWVLDKERNQYYYWDPYRRCRVYQASNQQTPRTAVPDLTNAVNAFHISPQVPPEDDNEEEEEEEEEEDDDNDDDDDDDEEPKVVGNFIQGPAERITDPTLLQRGITAHQRLTASPGESEKLDARYFIRRPGHFFFKVGKVFKVLWPEPAGNPQAGITFITGTYGEQFFAKIRWFVVIKEGQDFCTCLPIQTYNRQGVGKKGIVKSHHSIMFTGSIAPQPKPQEKPDYGEQGMRQPIAVIPTDPAESKMDTMSRVNYAKTYSVEHNVKAFDFGKVHPSYEHLLVHNFQSVWGLGMSQPTSIPSQQVYQQHAGPSGTQQAVTPFGRGAQSSYNTPQYTYASQQSRLYSTTTSPGYRGVQGQAYTTSPNYGAYSSYYQSRQHEDPEEEDNDNADQ